MKAKEQYCAFRTIVDKEVIRILRIWMQTLLPSAITMTLYFLIFGKFIGSQVRDINGFSYMEFIVPGIIMLSVITNSFMNVVSSFFSTKFMRSVEEILVSPTPNWIILIGYAAGGIFRGLLVGLIVLLVSLFFTHINIYNFGIIIIFILLTSIVFSLGGLLNAIFAKRFDDISIIPTFVLMPLTYLGGVFYSISVLPAFWQGISLLNPILYMVNGFRYGFLGISDINIWIGFGMLVIFAAILFYINLHLMKKGTGLKT
ncbi:ABC transporter permease [Candidatus Woesearchaeota archaeon]|nr:ABC transporter permease [Candidatus Woesearchaeota archaeon]|tara:strand:+ start:115 stop:888 length:774 start_codon:yes stop_codon:yes gene_type:complete